MGGAFHFDWVLPTVPTPLFLPSYVPVPRTLMGIFNRMPDVAEKIMNYALEEDIAFQVQPVYHEIDFMTMNVSTVNVWVPHRRHVDVQQGRMTHLDGNASKLHTRRTHHFAITQNPFRTFIEHNSWHVDDISTSLRQIIPAWATRPRALSTFEAVRLTCHDMYVCAWRIVLRDRPMTAQILGFGMPDLRNVVPNPDDRRPLDLRPRHPRIDNVEARIETLSMVPTYETATDYSSMIHNMPRLRWVMPGSVHMHWPRRQRIPGVSFSAFNFYCGLVVGDSNAISWLLALIDHLVSPRMFVRAGQTVTIVRQISLNADNDDVFPGTLNLLIGCDIPENAQSYTSPYIISAALEHSQQPRGRPPYRGLITISSARDVAAQYIKRRAAALASDTDPAANRSRLRFTTLSNTYNLYTPNTDWMNVQWTTYMAGIRGAVPAWSIADFVHRMYCNMGEVHYIFQRG